MVSEPPVPPEQAPGSFGTVPPPPPAAPGTLPWDLPNPASFAGFFETVKLVLLRPREAFTRMAPIGSYVRPIVFALLLGIAGLVVSQGYSLLFGDPFESLLRGKEATGPELSKAVTFLITVCVAPFLVAVVLALSTLITHAILILLGASGGGLGATFRVFCYSTAVDVFQLVPVLGSLVAIVWSFFPTIIGLAVVHKTSVAKAAVAILLPAFLCCLCCGGILWWAITMGRFMQ